MRTLYVLGTFILGAICGHSAGVVAWYCWAYIYPPFRGGLNVDPSDAALDGVLFGASLVAIPICWHLAYRTPPKA